MKIKQKYIRCFSQESSDSLKSKGYEFLHEKDGVYWFKNNESITVNFSDNDMKNIKYSIWINL